MIIYVDIDETICEHPKTSGKRDYAAATPLVKNIEKINKFYDAGHTIVYWTARGGTTGEDHSLLTSTQLDDWEDEASREDDANIHHAVIQDMQEHLSGLF